MRVQFAVKSGTRARDFSKCLLHPGVSYIRVSYIRVLLYIQIIRSNYIDESRVPLELSVSQRSWLKFTLNTSITVLLETNKIF